jgi:pseudouridine-5'-monophosphatase
LPDIYLLALETINRDLRANREAEIRPEECLVFEDAVPGVEAGRRAGMRVAWVPYPGLLQEYRGREEEVLAGLTGEHKEVEQPLASVTVDGPVETEPWRAIGSGKPGKVGDGWGDMLSSLEDFPYAKYGINVPQN